MKIFVAMSLVFIGTGILAKAGGNIEFGKSPKSGALSDGLQRPEEFAKSALYMVLVSGNVDRINAELAVITTVSIKEKEAYQGALLMKKAGLVSRPADKLKFFKLGRIKLETALLKDSSNGEYHFLRLAVQEHAPRIVKYYTDQEKDVQSIRHTFKTLSPPVQQAIIDYSKTSKILHPEDL
jgi:hypothetical protein